MLSTKQLFLLNTAQTSTSPKLLEIERAEGLYLYSPDGKRYLDFVSGFAVSNLGHRHPKVVEAIKKQVEAIKNEFNEKYNALLEEKKQDFLDQGGNEIDFHFT